MTAVKICGISSLEIMDAALQAGADYVGLVFFEPSPRNVGLVQARNLANLASGEAEVVVLTVDADNQLLDTIVGAFRPDIIQLHGGESPERVAQVAERTGTRTMKVIKVATKADAQTALDYKGVADLILFDAKPAPGEKLPGGNGLAFDWSALAGVAEQVPFMLAGGLNPETVAEAVHVTGAPIVDVSSGVECAPGVKDADLVRAFVAAAKSAAPATLREQQPPPT